MMPKPSLAKKPSKITAVSTRVDKEDTAIELRAS